VRAGIAVCNTPDYGTTDVADTAIAMMLALLRGTAHYDEVLRADVTGNWSVRNRDHPGACAPHLRASSGSADRHGDGAAGAGLRARCRLLDDPTSPTAPSSKPRARRAVAVPIRPSPTTPKVRPRTPPVWSAIGARSSCR